MKEIRGQEADVAAVANEWQEQLREKISTLDHCDFRREGFIDPSQVPEDGFNVVTTSGAFENVAQDKGEFAAMLKTCHSFLRQGGYMVAATYGKHNKYKVSLNAEKTFYALYVTEEMVREVLIEAGFNLEKFEVIKVDSVEFIPSECYCYVARKI